MRTFGYLLVTLSLAACGGTSGDSGGDKQDPGRAKYEADKRHCESISNVDAARKSCMTYRGWPDGKYRR